MEVPNALLSHLPEDSEVISFASHMVIRSQSAQSIYRVDKTELITNSFRIQDAFRSHRVSWCLGHKKSLAVVAPTDADPVIIGDYLISTYPLHRPISSITDLNEEQADDLGMTIASWATSCRDCDHDIDTLRVDDYVLERLGFASHNRSAAVVEAADQLKSTVENLSRYYSFNLLNTKFMGYVHGDMHHGNFVIDDGGRARIIDFDSFKFGTPLYDLGSLRYFERDHVEDRNVSERIISSFIEHYDRGRTKVTEDYLIAGEAWKRISSLSRLIVLSDGSEESLSGIDKSFTDLREIMSPLNNSWLRSGG